MGLTLQQVEERITALEDALSSGHESVAYSDKRVQFRSEADMQKTLNWLYRRREQLGGEAAPTGSRQLRVATGDGYDH